MPSNIPLYLSRNPEDTLDWIGLSRNPIPSKVVEPPKSAPMEPNPILGQEPSTYTNDPYWFSKQIKAQRALEKYLNFTEGAVIDKINAVEMSKQNPKGIDLTALGAFIDQLNNGKTGYAQAMKSMAPESPEERDKRLFDMHNSIADDYAQLASISRQSLDTAIGGLNDAVQLKNNRSEANRGQRFNMELGKDLGKLSDAVVGEQQKLAVLKNDVNNPNVNLVELQQSASNFARLLGETGVLSNFDIQRTQVNTLIDDINSGIQYIKGTPGAKPSHLKVQAMKAAINKIDRMVADGAKRRLQSIKARYEPQYGLVPQQNAYAAQQQISNIDSLINPKRADAKELVKGILK